MDELARTLVRCDLDIRDILQEGKRLVAQGWCQGAMARDAQGRAVEASSPTATTFDALGAIERGVLNLLDGERGFLIQNYYKGFYALVGELHTHSRFSAWNDDPARCQADILERFERALARAAQPASHASRVAA